MKHKVFLSHNSADKPAVEALALRLRKAEDKSGQQDIEPWLDKWNLIPFAADRARSFHVHMDAAGRTHDSADDAGRGGTSTPLPKG